MSKNKGSGVKINTTSEIPDSGTEGLDLTLAAYDKGWNMNDLNDPTGSHPEYDASGLGKSIRGSGRKP